MNKRELDVAKKNKQMTANFILGNSIEHLTPGNIRAIKQKLEENLIEVDRILGNACVNGSKKKARVNRDLAKRVGMVSLDDYLAQEQRNEFNKGVIRQ